jgi:hypothetical protein
MSVLENDRKRTVCNGPRKKVADGSSGSARCRALLLLLLALALLSPMMQAQLYTGSITGVVTDPSGSSVPGAKVILTDQDKGFVFNAETDATGRYLFRSVAPGTYKITVEAANFQSQDKTGVKLDVSQNVSLDFSLKVGTVNDIVEVKAETVQLQTEDAVTGQVVNRKFVNDLPLVDRNFTNLTYLAPGVTETSANGSKNAQGGINFNSNGSRNATADVLIDGASATNFDQNSGILNVPYTPSVDSVEEFKVQQTNFTAEYGFAGGTIINVVTRSGTNQFHGSAYEFFRNSVLDANDWFNNKNSQPIAPLKRNNFGGTFGGPIRKGKTFFFFDYEGTREHTATTPGFIGVPSLCERGEGPCPAGNTGLGNLSELCTLQGGTFDNTGLCSVASGQLWDPYSGVYNANPPQLDPNNTLGPGAVRSTFIPFNDLSSYTSAASLPGNQALQGTPFQLPAGPGNLIDPVAAKLLRLFPRPTINATDLATLQNANFFSAGANANSSDQFDIKVDHRFSDRDLLSVRYSQFRSSSTSFNSFGNFADPQTGGPGRTTRHLLSIDHTHTFSPTVLLTVTFGYVRGFDNFPGVAGQFPSIDSAFNQLGFPSYLNNGFKTIPSISINGYASSNGNNNIGSNPFSITHEGQDSYHLSGTVSWVRGKHELKFGGEGRMYRINHVNAGWPSGFFNFDSTGTNQIATETNTNSNGFPILGGDGLASFLIGVGSPNSGGGSGCTPCQQGYNNYASTQSFRFGTFAQDNYKLTPKLTLNLGMRYELNTPRTERFNRMSALDPNAVSPLQLTAAQLAVAQSDGLPASAIQSLGNLHGIPIFADSKNRHDYPTDYTNIQPRFGLAYQLPHNFVIRGGYGIYFSTPRNGAAGTGPIAGYEGYNIQPAWLTTYNIDHATPWNTLKNTSCAFTPPYTCSVAPPGSNLNAFTDLGAGPSGPIAALNHDTPYEQAWSFGFQKQLPGKILLDTSYVGKKGTHLYFGGNQNIDRLPLSAFQGQSPTQLANLQNLVANPFFFSGPGACDQTHYICNQAVGGLATSQVQEFQLLLPFPQYTLFQGDSFPVANSIYHALQVRAEKDFSNGLQFLVTYVWSKSIDNASATDGSVVFLGGGNGGNTLNVQNPYDIRSERSVSVFDIPQVLQVSYVYEIPFGRGRAFGRDMNPILNAVVGGWQTNGIVRIDDGRPLISLLSGGTPIPIYNGVGQRPNLSAPLQRASGSPEDFTTAGGPTYFSNPQVATVPANYTFGNAPRTITSVRQPGARDVSMSLFKEFNLGMIREGMRLEFRAESFNTFNHPHFNGPDSTVGSSNFGIITSTVNTARELQLALKLYF